MWLPGVQFVVCYALVHSLIPVFPDLSDDEDVVLDLVALLPFGRPPVFHCQLALFLRLQNPPVLQPLVLDVWDPESLARPEQGVPLVDVLVPDGDGEHRPGLDAEKYEKCGQQQGGQGRTQILEQQKEVCFQQTHNQGLSQLFLTEVPLKLRQQCKR